MALAISSTFGNEKYRRGLLIYPQKKGRGKYRDTIPVSIYSLVFFFALLGFKMRPGIFHKPSFFIPRNEHVVASKAKQS